MNKFLHIETATKVCSVAISQNGELTDFIEESSDSYIHAEKLTLFIEEICKRNEMELSDFNAIVVSGGPGSYTGLRIGVTTAKGLCYALRLPLISINTLDSIAYLANQKYPGSTICTMIDARRMEVFSTIYNSDLDIIKPLSADVLEENTYSNFESFVACGDGASKIKDLWSNRPIIIDDAILSSAKGQVKLAYNKFLNNEFEDVAYYEPYYLKDFVSTKKKG